AHPLRHVLHHHVIGGDPVLARRIEADRHRPDWLELRASHSLAGSEQRHVVALRHQLFGQPRNDALGSTVQRRRNGLEQRRDLGNAHDYIHLFCRVALRLSNPFETDLKPTVLSLITIPDTLSDNRNRSFGAPSILYRATTEL